MLEKKTKRLLVFKDTVWLHVQAIYVLDTKLHKKFCYLVKSDKIDEKNSTLRSNVNYFSLHIFHCQSLGFRLEHACRGVPVPYWDSTVDHVMPDPTRSILWSEQFFGNGDGQVLTGPFRNFQTTVPGDSITREIGTSG